MYEVVPDFGSIYDAVPLYAARTDVLFYVSEAEKVQGTVLELGCGTGRVLLPLARAGHTVVGLDGSPQMLARCKTKLRDEPRPFAIASRFTKVTSARSIWAPDSRSSSRPSASCSSFPRSTTSFASSTQSCVIWRQAAA